MTRRRLLMILGLVAAAVGDWFMAGPGRNFVTGVWAFSAAQTLWMSANVREGRFAGRTALFAAMPLAALFVWRVAPAVSSERLALMAGYACLSVVALAVARGTRRRWYGLGIACLFISDVAIALRLAHVPHWKWAVGPFYLTALACLVASTVRDADECRTAEGGPISQPLVQAGGGLAAALFVCGMLVSPGSYNPFMMMLSRLGRTHLAGVDYPLCHYLFTFGLFVAAAAISRALTGWSGALTAAGLLTIAAVPENISMVGHNLGCHLATIGGAWTVGFRSKCRMGRIVRIALFGLVGAFAMALVLHAARVIPFAPAVPTLQKAVILSFALWVAFLRRT